MMFFRHWSTNIRDNKNPVQSDGDNDQRKLKKNDSSDKVYNTSIEYIKIHKKIKQNLPKKTAFLVNDT